MLMISLACRGEGAVAAVETEVAPIGHCFDLTTRVTSFVGGPLEMNRSRPGAPTRERKLIA
jgi:hypothetical protein